MGIYGNLLYASEPKFWICFLINLNGKKKLKGRIVPRFTVFQHGELPDSTICYVNQNISEGLELLTEKGTSDIQFESIRCTCSGHCWGRVTKNGSWWMHPPIGNLKA